MPRVSSRTTPAGDRRSEARHRARRLLQRQSPRLQMFTILVLTGGFGFLVSWGLLTLGLSALWIRYPLAVALAYGAFLLLLRLWLGYQRRRHGHSRDLSDLLDPSLLDLGGGIGPGGTGRFAGGGGRFGGAGASGSYQGPAPLPMGDPGAASVSLGDYAGSGASGGSPDLGGILELSDLDEDTLPFVVALAALAALFSVVLIAGYVVWTAPVLLAELLVDGLVVSALSHRLKRIDSPSWVRGVLRRTWLPATGIALLLGMVGRVLQVLSPGIDSIGDVLARLGWP